MAQHFVVLQDKAPKTLRDWLSFLPEVEVSKIKFQIKRLLSGQARIDTEIDFHCADGLLHSLKLTGALHRDNEGLVDRINGACFDLTPERRLFMELQEQSSKRSVTLSAIGDGVIATDRDCNVTWINEVASRLTGWSLEEVVGHKSSEVFAVFDETSGAPAVDPVQKCLREGQIGALQHNSVLRMKEGDRIAIDDSAAPIMDASGHAIGAIVIFHDVSEQRALSRHIEYRATHDLLTGLLNRVEFNNRLTKCLADPIIRNSSYLFFRSRSLQTAE